ncbi:MAG: TMEM14 family protein [bacterium]|nr:TMEM14 family protein [Candidatus Kapabacteria bacterium]
MRTVALYEMLFGLLTIVGGIFGYTETAMWEPLIAGIAGGALLIGGALKMQKGGRSGLFTNLIVTVLLLAYAIMRFIADGVFLPGGLMIIVAGISLLLLLLLLVQPKERKRIF